MSGTTELYIDLAILVLSFFSGISRFRRLDIAGRILVLLLLAEFVNEVVAHAYAKKYLNNMRVYNIYSILEFALLSLYFNYSIDVFRRMKLGYYIVVVGLIFAVINYTLIQQINTFNSYYLFFEGFTTITLSLISFYRLLMYNEDLKLSRYHHFWFTAVFLFFWSITFLSWGVFPLMFKNKEVIGQMISFIWIVNIITYGGVGIIFQLYPQKQISHE